MSTFLWKKENLFELNMTGTREDFFLQVRRKMSGCEKETAPKKL